MVFIAVVTIIPIACSTWLGRRVHEGIENSLIDKNLGRISVIIDGVLKRAKLMSAIGVAATLLFFCMSLTLKPDQRESDNLPMGSEATAAYRHMDTAFGGLEFSRVDIKWNSSVDSESAEVLDVVTEVDDLLNSEELIGHPLSIRNLIDAQPGSGPAAERMTLMELLPPPLKRAFFTPEHRYAKVTFRVQDLDDPYVCLAKRYYQYFTGFDVNISDLGDSDAPDLSEGHRRHRLFVIGLGQRLKSHQNLTRLIEEILKSSQYRQSDFY